MSRKIDARFLPALKPEPYIFGNRRAWYDRHTRVWTCQVVDAEGNQVGDAEHEPKRKLAMHWLKTGSFFDLPKLTRQEWIAVKRAIAGPSTCDPELAAIYTKIRACVSND